MVKIFKGGKVTVPYHVRELHGVCDGDYVRVELVEVLKRNDSGEWVRRRVGSG